MNLEDIGWRIFDAGANAWFDTPSQTAGAALVDRIAELADEHGLPNVDLRTTGVRVRIAGSASYNPHELALEISAAAEDLGLAPDPASLQVMRLVIDAVDPTSFRTFWQTVLDYEPVWPADLVDPLRRDPAISFQHLDEPRPVRNRIHVDVSRSPEAVDAAKAALGRTTYGAYDLTIADDEGNEIDLVPADDLPGTTDWRTQFGAMTFYATASPAQASRLATAVAGLADDACIPVLVDLCPAGVTIDSGKDQWETDEGGADPGFVKLAARIEAAAHELDLRPDPTRLRFIQLGFDAIDVPAVRAFWTTVLGYRHDPRAGLSDIYDPRRLNPVLFFQQLAEPRQQRNRVRLELAVPSDQVQSRIDAGLSAGGSIVGEQPHERCTLADPEGNEVDLVLPPWSAQET